MGSEVILAQISNLQFVLLSNLDEPDCLRVTSVTVLSSGEDRKRPEPEPEPELS